MISFPSRQNEEAPLIDPVDDPRKPFSVITRACIAFQISMVVLSVIVYVVLKIVILSYTNHSTVIHPSQAQRYSAWRSNIVEDDGGRDIRMDIYVFDILNPVEASLKGQRPHLSEKGPYSFKEYYFKHDIGFAQDNSTVYFIEQKYYIFDKEHSSPDVSELDNFTTLNLALQNLYHDPYLNKAAFMRNAVTKGFLCDAWSHKLPMYSSSDTMYTPFITVPVLKYMFGLHKEPLYALAHSIINSVNPDHIGLIDTNITTIEDSRATRGPTHMLTRLKEPNSTYTKWNGAFTIHTCCNPKYNHVYDSLAHCPVIQPHWTPKMLGRNRWVSPWGKSASKVKGLSMTQFPVNGKAKAYKIFVERLSRVFDIVRHKNIREVNKLPGHKYTISDDTFLTNRTKGYDMTGPDGLLNYSKTTGYPMFMSKPHFLDADPVLQTSISGLKPNRSRHDTYLLINDVTGVSLENRLGMQFNGYLINWNLPSTILPITPFGCSSAQADAWDGNWVLNNTDGVYIPIAYFIETSRVSAIEANRIRNILLLYSAIPFWMLLFGIFNLGLTAVIVTIHAL